MPPTQSSAASPTTRGTSPLPRTMRAAISRGRRALPVEDLPLPEPGPGEVRVRVSACGVCGTDLHLFHAGLFPAGMTPGHEIAGSVDRAGPGVSGFAQGEAVVVEPLRTCGHCRECQAGRDSICAELHLLGLHERGGMAQYVVVPSRRLFRAPEGLDPRIAALTEPAAVVLHGLRRGNLVPGQRVLVIGAGTVGLLGVLAARALGAGEVWLAARHPHQRTLGERFGASQVLDEAEATPQALAARAKRQPADLVLETVGGKADTLRAAGAALAPGGSVSVLGVFLGSVQLDPYPLLLKEATLAWSNCYARSWSGSPRADFEDAVALVDGERELLAGLVTHSVSLGEVERAFEIASDKKAGAVKVSVLPFP